MTRPTSTRLTRAPAGALLIKVGERKLLTYLNLHRYVHATPERAITIGKLVKAYPAQQPKSLTATMTVSNQRRSGFGSGGLAPDGCRRLLPKTGPGGERRGSASCCKVRAPNTLAPIGPMTAMAIEDIGFRSPRQQQPKDQSL